MFSFDLFPSFTAIYFRHHIQTMNISFSSKYEWIDFQRSKSLCSKKVKQLADKYFDLICPTFSYHQFSKQTIGQLFQYVYAHFTY